MVGKFAYSGRDVLVRISPEKYREHGVCADVTTLYYSFSFQYYFSLKPTCGIPYHVLKRTHDVNQFAITLSYFHSSTSDFHRCANDFHSSANDFLSSANDFHRCENNFQVSKNLQRTPYN